MVVKMNKKQNIIEICVYVLIIVLLLFGVGKVKKEKPSEKPPRSSPSFCVNLKFGSKMII